MRILVVEDDPVTRVWVTSILQDERHEVEQACTGGEAIEKLAHSTYDVLVLDMVLVGLTGVDVLHKSQHLPAKIVITTADESTIKGIETPLNIVLKPFTREELLKAIQ